MANCVCLEHQEGFYQNNTYEVTSRCCPDGAFVKTSTGQLLLAER